MPDNVIDLKTASRRPAARQSVGTKTTPTTAKPPARGGGRPRKNANANATVTADELIADDEVKSLEAQLRLTAQKLARPDVSERDFAALARSFRQTKLDLKEARELAAAARLGHGRRRAAGGRSLDGDI